MMTIEGTEQRRAFAHWLRTGQRPSVSDAGVELKFNPWHDPDDGKFANAGAGRYFGPGSARSADRRPSPKRRVVADGNRKRPAPGPVDKVVEFVGGVRQGARDVGKETVTSLYEVATTNPATTVRKFGEGIAKSIGAAVAAEDTPAREQVRRTAHTIANASAHDLGYATGRFAANAGLAVAPGAAVTKVSAVRALKVTRPRETLHPPSTTWPKETISKEGSAKSYNDSAPGARAGHAPALMRTMPDGSQRPVKFDGIDGDYLIDRKWKVVTRPRARAQLLRQVEALTQNRQIGVWEVPNQAEKANALRLFKQMNVKVIKVRIVKP